MKLDIISASPEDENTVQRIFQNCPSYFRKVEGCEVGPGFAKHEMNDRPSKMGPGYGKVFCIIRMDDEPVGIVDLHQNHPETGIVYLGLLLLDERFQSRGLGRKIYEFIESLCQSGFKAQKIRLGISEHNRVEGFWEKMGFIRNGHGYEHQGQALENATFEMEKQLLPLHLAQ